MALLYASADFSAAAVCARSTSDCSLLHAPECLLEVAHHVCADVVGQTVNLFLQFEVRSVCKTDLGIARSPNGEGPGADRHVHVVSLLAD